MHGEVAIKTESIAFDWGSIFEENDIQPCKKKKKCCKKFKKKGKTNCKSCPMI